MAAAPVAEVSMRRAPVRFAIGGVIFACALVSGVAPTRARERLGFRDPIPVPAGAVVKLEVDRIEWFVGENVLVHFVVENHGTSPFDVDAGGDNRGMRESRYKVVAIDAAGHEVPDPNPRWDMNFGGLGAGGSVPPGGRWEHSLEVLRYRDLREDGVYRIRVSHDLGWEATEARPTPVAETQIRVRRPTPDEARKLVAKMQTNVRPITFGATPRLKPFADFTLIRDPVYSAPLRELASHGSKDAVDGLASIATSESTAALVALLSHADAELAFHAAKRLTDRLPDPELYGGPPGAESGWHTNDDALRERRKLPDATWHPEHAGAVRTYARTLLAHNGLPRIAKAAFLLTCVGTSDDLPWVLTTLDWLMASPDRDTRTEDDDHWIFSVRSTEDHLLRTVDNLVIRGASLPEVPATAAEAAAYLHVGGLGAKFRPAGWDDGLVRLASSPSARVREQAMAHAVPPGTDSLRRRVPDLLVDPAVEVVLATLGFVERTRDSAFVDAVLVTMETTHSEDVLERASEVAAVLGGAPRNLEVLVRRLAERSTMTAKFGGPGRVRDAAMRQLVRGALDGGGSFGLVEEAEVPALIRAWRRFLATHGDQIAAGRRFRIGDPALTPDLLPTSYHLESVRGGIIGQPGDPS